MNSQIIESKEGNYYVKKRGIPKGCELCLKGAKAVLFLNGFCQNPPHCSWYCPISEERKNQPRSYINELELDSKKDLLTEFTKMDALGMSITGGEPLLPTNLRQTLDYIQFIKNAKGKEFHIHLYTNGINFNKSIANKLADAGLDEIRFHPPQNKWNNIKLALHTKMKVGAEVPLIPQKSYLQSMQNFISYLDEIGAQFINLNEFEYCFPNSKSLKEKGFRLKKDSIASVDFSKESALNLMKEIVSSSELKIHFCSIRAKDYFQLKNRYLRRAKNIKRPFEEITEEGLLIYGLIEGDSIEIEELNVYLKTESGIPEELVYRQFNSLYVPYYLLIDDNFIDFLSQYDLKAYVLETLPFLNEKHKHITEKTPIKIFKEEFDVYKN